ncbi:MAG: class I SAM-dependent methyltransferase [Clostridiales bacterium]|nr:class I SAM-dependent methyltransferase [Clostridiales bacterium]
MYNDVINHYDCLVDENNDPARDPKIPQDYMNKWDGPAFISELQLSSLKEVLEIGLGTGRLALKTAPLCKHLTGIDFSPKTIIRAEENLLHFDNVSLINADFFAYPFEDKYDVIYSSLTFMYIKSKQKAINKVASLLKSKGIFVLSIDKNQSEYIDYAPREIKVYPSKPNDIELYIMNTGLNLYKQFETEYAIIFVACTQ